MFGASAANTASISGSATLLSQVAIGTSISGHDLTGVVEGGNLKFGNIGIGTTASVVKVDEETGLRTLTSGDAGLTNTAITPTAAAFKVTGGANLTYGLTLPASTTMTSGANSLNISSFAAFSSGTLNASGEDFFSVGASLAVPSNAVAGAYTGTYTVTVVYN